MAIKKYKPELMSSTVQNPDVLPEKRGHQFFYMCHPNAWEFVGGEWLRCRQMRHDHQGRRVGFGL